MQRKLCLAVSFLLVLVAGGVANAQRAPDTATMDRGDGITRFGLDFGLSFLEHPPYDAALRIEPYGQYVTNSGYGIYGTIPFAHSFGGDGRPMGADDTTALGNLELGGLYVMSGETLSWVFRGGLALPTASDSEDGPLTNALATTPRLTDYALAAPDAMYVRLGVSPLYHANKLFLQADIGFDLGIGIGEGSDADHFFRFNVGGGIDLGMLSLGLELANLARFDDVDDNDQFVHALAFTIRFMGEQFQPVIAIGAPLDDLARDQVNLFVSAGFQVVFR